jgi:hypothetical protein
MSKEKQIKEMWNIITTDCDSECDGCEFENDNWCFTRRVINNLYNAGYRKQSEWISVEERLPEDKQICLVYGTVFYVPEETESEEIFTTAFYKEFGFVEQIHAHITHWMPLPEPPKKGGGE